MATRPLSTPRGRDFRALVALRDRLRAGLGKAFHGATWLSRRPLDVPQRPSVPAPDAPAELRVLVRVERRDVWTEEQVDRIALDIALETGTLPSPLVLAAEELDSPLARASRLAEEAAAGEDVR